MTPCHETPEVEPGLSMHTSATVSKSATVLGFFMAISSTVLRSLMLSRKALIITEMLDIIAETPIMLLLDGIKGLDSRWALIGALKVPDEHVRQLISGVNGSFG
jgi:hypothetical protein